MSTEGNSPKAAHCNTIDGVALGRGDNVESLPWSLISLCCKPIAELLRLATQLFAVDRDFPFEFSGTVDNGPYTHTIEANAEKKEHNSTRPYTNPMPGNPYPCPKQASVN